MGTHYTDTSCYMCVGDNYFTILDKLQIKLRIKKSEEKRAKQ